MHSPTSLLRRLLLWFLCSQCFSAAHAQPKNLWQAARENDVSVVRQLLLRGMSVDTRDAEGLTPLMHAARAGSFESARELIWQGADPALRSPQGQSALDQVSVGKEESLPLKLLLRLQLHLPSVTRVSSRPPTRPNLVMLYEPTVNYYHPKIKEAYYINAGELNGRQDFDDDSNGFIDDIYGYNIVSDRGHLVTKRQLDTYQENRQLIAHLFNLHNQHERGDISDNQFLSATQSNNNPIALMFGASAGFNDRNFLELARKLSHGSHVGGIVLEHSRGTALLHTLSWEEFESVNDLRLLRSLDMDALFNASRDFDDFFERYRVIIRDSFIARGKRASTYLQTTGAGVANLSMGKNFNQESAIALAANYARAAKRAGRPSPDLTDEATKQKISRYSWELHFAMCAEFAVMFRENPDVLFVCAAGNDHEDNDETLQAPAYLARFYPNVISVAAVDGEGRPAEFSNYGEKSVEIAAPGVKILSTAIPESPLILSGTSMAAPAIAGAAAYVRKQQPTLSAATLKKYLLYSTSGAEKFRSILAQGVLGEDLLFRSVAGDPAIRAQALSDMAARALVISGRFERLPGGHADFDWLISQSLELAPNLFTTWQTRAMFFSELEDYAQAEVMLDRAISCAPAQWRLWSMKAALYRNQGKTADVKTAFQEAIAIAEHTSTTTPDDLARLHIARGLTQASEVDRNADFARALSLSSGKIFLPNIRYNLRLLASAADQYYLENGAETTTYAQLVGEGKYIREITTFAGENYQALVFKQGAPLEVKTVDGHSARWEN